MEIIDSLFGMFYGPYATYFAIASVITILALGYLGAPLLLWTIGVGCILVGWNAPMGALVAFLIFAAVFNTPIRRFTVSAVVLNLMKKLGLVPSISDTERTALDAGVVWVEKDLFSGSPNFSKIIKDTSYPELTEKEKVFVNEKVDKLCAMVDDWKYWETREVPQEAFDYMKKEKFFGMIIPEEYGGLGLSALAHGAVVKKLATRSVGMSIFVMVPNSLGPAELLLHYGTKEQKDKYLPRLADGREIPCFALTEPTAGSDAGSITSGGVVFKGNDGKLYIRLNWNKRWITLAAISTLLGVAFRLRDPENLLGKGEDVGITCALIPTTTPGVEIGQRHDPLGVPFHNCPTEGHDVVVPLEEVVVGGANGCGRGWTMLMDCLSAGRGISLPSQAAGGGEFVSRMVSAHATNRKQFGLAIGKFEGVEEAMARIVSNSYLVEANRRFTAGAIDSGVKPPVVTAIAKYFNSEIMREIINDGMDIMGGAGISRGPRNVLAHSYIAAPIAITVEGANILTRTLMIFGQGSLRAHPYAYAEVSAVEKNDLAAFDKAFWGHMGHIATNLFRSILLSLTRGRLAGHPGGPAKRCYQKLVWTSACFALLADIAMVAVGASLKTKGKLTGRFADILGWMYLGTSILKRFEAEGRRKEDLPIVQHAMNRAFNEIQSSFIGILENIPIPGLSWFFAGPLAWWGRINRLDKQVSDKTSHKVAQLIQEDSEQRDRLTAGIFLHSDPNDPARKIDDAFKMVKKAQGVERKIKKAIRSKQLPKKRVRFLMDDALKANIISQEEYDSLHKAVELRLDAIQVDDFSQKEYIERKGAVGAKSQPGGTPSSSQSKTTSGGGGGGSAATSTTAVSASASDH